MKMKSLKGAALTKGRAEGTVCLYKEDLLGAAPKYKIPASKVQDEKDRLRQGIEKTKDELKDIYNRVSGTLSATESEIFYAHIIILEDFTFINSIEKVISEKRVNAEWAVILTIEDYKNNFRQLPGDYIRERAEDINDIAKRIISNLGYKHTGFACKACRPSSAVVASERLTTSLISHLGEASPAGVLVEKGSANSHGAIMARALGVPVLIKVEGLISSLGCGTPVIIDADNEKVYINPDAKTRQRLAKTRAFKSPFKKLDKGLLETKDGEKIKISINASGIKDIEKGMEKGAVDIGLFRTEFLFTGRSARPGVSEQEKIYSDVIKASKGETAFRLLDAGSDKEMPFLNLPPQDNPDLGLRGVRIYKRYPEILNEQVEALLKAKGDKPVKIIVPMVSSIQEFIEVRKTILAKLARLGKQKPDIKNTLLLGCMIELPSAVHTIKDFVRECDFLSIGTNDLIQYLVGADRNSDYLEELSNPIQPAVVNVLNLIAEKSLPSGREVTVCGEMAGSPSNAEILVGLGYKSLSLNPSGIEETAERLRGASYKKMKEAAEAILRASGG
jgi:phosphoenolpyruvate-protein phosphotransferase (PTS system enzyme I)